jgi:catechol 2,3-dioxygenase-like lactoylglutathione lyase family enzyme
MALRRLQHLLIQTEDIAGTVAWWRAALGMETGPHPDFGFPVEWLYIGDTDVIHLTQGGAGASAERAAYLPPASDATRGSGAIDHIAFDATDARGTLDRLAGLGIAATTRRANKDAPLQAFLFDPNGIKVELNFPPEECAGIEAEMTAR